MSARLSRLLLSPGILIAVLSVACSAPAPTSSSAPAAPAALSTPPPAPVADEPLTPATLPDLSNVAAPVRGQIQARDAALRATLAKTGASAAEKAKAYGDLADVLMAATFFGEARLCYRHAAAQEPDEARWPYLVGHATLRAGDRARAATAFEAMLALEPAYAPALVWLGDVQLDLGLNDGAQATFAKALTLAPDSAAVLFGAGRAAIARGAYAEALSYLEHAQQLDPSASAINYPLAMTYRRMGMADRAAPLLQKTGSVAPAMADPLLRSAEVVLDSAVAHESVGMAALRAQDWAGAIAAFRRGLALAPGDPSLRYWMASAMIASGDAAGAEREFREVVRRHPDYAKAHFSLGAMADQRGQRAEAQRAYEAAVRYAPNMPDARVRLGATLQAQGKLREAVVQFESAVALDPNQLPAWIGGAQALVALGDRNQAREWLARARRLHPANAPLAQIETSVR